MPNDHVHPPILAAITSWIPPYTEEQAIAADLQYNADKNSGKLLKDKVDATHKQELNVRHQLGENQ